MRKVYQNFFIEKKNYWKEMLKILLLDMLEINYM